MKKTLWVIIPIALLSLMAYGGFDRGDLLECRSHGMTLLIAGYVFGVIAGGAAAIQ